MVRACGVCHIKAAPGFVLDTSTRGDTHSAAFCSCCHPPLTMPPFDVKRVRSAVWKWLCRCPDVIGPTGDVSGEEEFFTPPTSPVLGGNFVEPSIIAPAGDAQRLLSPAQTRRLRRRHAEVVRQLTTPPPAVTPRPHSPLKAYQRPVMVYRPNWAP